MYASYFEVHTAVGDGWENVWNIDDQPQAFRTAAQAQKELDEHLVNLSEAYDEGSIDTPANPEDYKLIEVILKTDLTEYADLWIKAIIKRAKRMQLCTDSLGEMHTASQLALVHLNGCPLDLQKLYDSNSYDFAHDILEIRANLDIVTGKLLNYFTPRCAISD